MQNSSKCPLIKLVAVSNTLQHNDLSLTCKLILFLSVVAPVSKLSASCCESPINEQTNIHMIDKSTSVTTALVVSLLTELTQEMYKMK